MWVVKCYSPSPFNAIVYEVLRCNYHIQEFVRVGCFLRRKNPVGRTDPNDDAEGQYVPHTA